MTAVFDLGHGADPIDSRGIDDSLRRGRNRCIKVSRRILTSGDKEPQHSVTRGETAKFSFAVEQHKATIAGRSIIDLSRIGGHEEMTEIPAGYFPPNLPPT
jgi:hypothetical protein